LSVVEEFEAGSTLCVKLGSTVSRSEKAQENLSQQDFNPSATYGTAAWRATSPHASPARRPIFGLGNWLDPVARDCQNGTRALTDECGAQESHNVAEGEHRT
jgi:hypothetical protein